MVPADIAALVPEHRAPPADRPAVAVLGLGYVGLPTGLALAAEGVPVVGIDASVRRLEAIRARRADLLPRDRARLEEALAEGGLLELTADPALLAAADAVLVCVPTPVDELHRPDLTILRRACETVVAHARRGQTIVLTSTSHVGTTRELLVAPLAARGLHAGEDVHVAFSPERIDPGNALHAQESVPRVVGGATSACAEAAAAVLGLTAAHMHVVSSPEAAEMAKLHENSFRAVNIAFANEMADAARRLGLDPAEVLEAAATKPYGFMRFEPGPGVGGHCIPCDPHYLTARLRERGGAAPLLERAMAQIHERPLQVVDRAAAMLGALAGRRVLVVGAAYKPGIADVRQAPAIEILAVLRALGAEVAYHDPLVGSVELPGGLTLLSAPGASAAEHDLAIVVTLHPGHDYGWIERCPRVLRP